MSLASGLTATASGQLAVHRLSAPARTASKDAATAVDPAAARRAALQAANPGIAPASLDAMQERARRSHGVQDLLGRGSIDWSLNASRRRGFVPRALARRDLRAPGIAADLSLPPEVVRLLIIRVDFAADRGGKLSTGSGRFDLSGPDLTVAPIDRPPHNRTFYQAHLTALARYYDVQSYGRVAIEGDVWPRSEDDAYSLSDMADFGPWRFSQNVYPQAVEIVRSCLIAADTQARDRFSDPIPWDDYDRVLIIHAGSDFQSDIRGDSPEDPITFTLGLGGDNRVTFPGMQPIDRAALLPETSSQDEFHAAINGVIAHECGHLLFGFADLYDIFTGQSVDGYWTLMDSGNNVGSPVTLPNGEESFAIGLLPPSLDPFHRFILSDALSFTDVVWGQTMSLANSERNPDMRRVPLSSDEYLVLENRYIAPGNLIQLDQDSTTRVVLGPKTPDRFEYDALLPTVPTAPGAPEVAGGGILVWHIDASVIPFSTALRIDLDNDYGYNSLPFPKGIEILEADGLDDLGDPSSPFYSGSPYDPYFRSNNPTLADGTVPNLKPNTGTLPHARLEFLDDQGPVMHFSAAREWQLAQWPVASDFPPGGPLLLSVDADGALDHLPEVCWAGGAVGSRDSAALFAVRADGNGLASGPHAFAHLPDGRRPRPLMAALPIGDALLNPRGGPSYFAVSTFADPQGGGQVWLFDHTGAALTGWGPVALPSIVTTPPVIVGSFPNFKVLVGCANGSVYEIAPNGQPAPLVPALPGGVSGRLAAWRDPSSGEILVAAGGADGDVAVISDAIPPPSGTPWPRRLGGAGFAPDFLWVDFDGNGHPATGTPTCASARPVMVVHSADRLWAFCPEGTPLPGWGRSLGDTLVAGLGVGDPDGDGYAEVLTQSITSKVAFINQSGYPSPGWPRIATGEGFRTDSPALAIDVDGDHRAEVVALDASGILVALRGDGRVPAGWPLATGVGVVGAPVALDLDGDGSLEIVAPDRDVPPQFQGGVNGRFGSLYAYSLPSNLSDPTAIAWPMLGGDPGRSSSLTGPRGPTAPPASAGPLEGGSLRAFPNPARRRPVSFAYRLTEPADVDFTILDSSGHEVASFTRAGRRADNLEIWDPGSVPAGLYVARLRFRGVTSTHHEAVTLGLLR